MPKITHSDLQRWSSRAEGIAGFGELVRRLVWDSVFLRHPRIHFLAGETNNQSGVDGLIEFQMEDGRVHRSIWEISTRSDYEQKFIEDYKSCIEKAPPEGWDRKQIIYVGATLQKVTPARKAKIRTGLINEFGCPWGWIVLLDAEDFVHWIEKSPSVEAWFGFTAQLGPGRFGRSLEQAWDGWAKESNPRLTVDMVTAGRSMKDLQLALRFEQSAEFTVQGDSTNEALGLLYSTVARLSEREAEAIFATSLVVPDASAAEQLEFEQVPKDAAPIVVLLPAARRKAQNLISKGYRVINLTSRTVPSSPNTVSFERADVEGFASALISVKSITQKAAEQEARECGCSVSVWQIRNLYSQGARVDVLPVWASEQHAASVVPAVLMGGWNATKTGDHDVIRILSDLDPTKFMDAVHRFLRGDDPLLETVGSDTFVVAPTAAFAFIADKITSSHLERFAKACMTVFSVIESEVESHWEGKENPTFDRTSGRWSEWLSDGLAESLLRIAILDVELIASGALMRYGSGQQFVDHLVHSLPGLNSDPRVMASLDQRLPILAEAAPRPFLQALESLVESKSDSVARWLADEGGVFGRSYHTGLLWALEKLAWLPEFFEQSVVLLACLAELDPGGHISNRPLNSLTEIFRAWHRQTFASLEAREAALRQVNVGYPGIAWSLLLSILPRAHDTANFTARPTWRRAKLASGALPTRAEANAASSRYVSLALESAGFDLEKLRDLVPVYPRLSGEHQARLLSQIHAATIKPTLRGATNDIWEDIRGLIAKHETFAEATWAMDDAAMVPLKKLLNAIVPQDLLAARKWLFDSQTPELGSSRGDSHTYLERLRAERVLAVAEIRLKNGIRGINELVATVKYPYLAANALAETNILNSELLDVLDGWRRIQIPRYRDAIQTVSGVRAFRDPTWPQSLISLGRARSWPDEDLGAALLDFPDTDTTFDLVDGLGSNVRQFYWKHRYGYLRIEDGRPDLKERCAEALLEFHRAADLIDFNRQTVQGLGYAFAVRVVQSFVEDMDTYRQKDRMYELSYDLQELFDWLRKQKDCVLLEIARIEYALLPLLVDRGISKIRLALHTIMASNPAFFIDVLCDLFKPANDEMEDHGRTLEEIKARAHAAYTLFNTWNVYPGERQDGSIDEPAFNEWIRNARAMARERDRIEVCDEKIGEILFHATSAEHKNWPISVVRETIENLKSDALEEGILVAAINAMGVSTRGMFDGGNVERHEAQIWFSRAEKLSEGFHRTKLLCMRIGRSWERLAIEWDRQIKKRKSKYSRQ